MSISTSARLQDEVECGSVGDGACNEHVGIACLGQDRAGAPLRRHDAVDEVAQAVFAIQQRHVHLALDQLDEPSCRRAPLRHTVLYRSSAESSRASASRFHRNPDRAGSSAVRRRQTGVNSAPHETGQGMDGYVSNYSQTHPCPTCHHTDHEISKDLQSFTLFYGEVHRPALYCTQCPCTQPLVLPAWLAWKWGWRIRSWLGKDQP